MNHRITEGGEDLSEKISEKDFFPNIQPEMEDGDLTHW